MSLYQANLVEDQGLVKKFECKISGFEIGASVEKQLAELQATAHLKGFRKGKAPMNVIQESYFGKVFYDVINKQANKAITEIAETNVFELATSPKVELDAESSLPADRNTANIRDVTIKITYEVMPDTTSVDLSTLDVEKFVLELADADLQAELENLAKHHATNEDKDGKIENGDVAIIDFTGYKDGEKFPGGEAQGYKLEIGSKSFIEGFEEGLVGLKAGEETTLKVTFPVEYHEKELAGKPVEFKVVVQKVQKKTPAQINDELAQKLGFETIDLLKEDIKKTFCVNYENSYKNNLKADVFEKIKHILDFDVPPSFKPKDEDKTPNETLASIRLSLFLSGYAKKHNIDVSQQDFMQYISAIAKMYGQNPKMIFDMYEKNQQMKQSVFNLLYENKIYETVFDAIPSTPKVVSKNEFDAVLKSFEEKNASKNIEDEANSNNN